MQINRIRIFMLVFLLFFIKQNQLNFEYLRILLRTVSNRSYPAVLWIRIQWIRNNLASWISILTIYQVNNQKISGKDRYFILFDDITTCLFGNIFPKPTQKNPGRTRIWIRPDQNLIELVSRIRIVTLNYGSADPNQQLWYPGFKHACTDNKVMPHLVYQRDRYLSRCFRFLVQHMMCFGYKIDIFSEFKANKLLQLF